jgi:hypothetical protein
MSMVVRPLLPPVGLSSEQAPAKARSRAGTAARRKADLMPSS